jgi:hypothetical protein
MNRFYGSHILDTPILQLRLHHHGTDPANNAGGFKQPVFVMYHSIQIPIGSRYQL